MRRFYLILRLLLIFTFFMSLYGAKQVDSSGFSDRRFEITEEILEKSGTCALPVVPDPDKDALYGGNAWGNGATIKVYFLNGTLAQKQFVEHYARTWEMYGNFKFEFHFEKKTNKDHAIVIEFKKLNPGVAGRSYVGSGTTSTTSASMWYNPDLGVSSFGIGTVQHEFGHALGMSHEQNNPGGKFYWKQDMAYEYFKKNYGWDKEKVDRAIFEKAQQTRTEWSKFDRSSTMAYSISGKYFKDGYGMGSWYGLSSKDRREIAAMYPGKDRIRGDGTMLFIYDDDTDLVFESLYDYGEIWVNGKVVKSFGPKYEVYEKKYIRAVKQKIKAAEILDKTKINQLRFRFWRDKSSGNTATPRASFRFEGTMAGASSSCYSLECLDDGSNTKLSSVSYVTHADNRNQGNLVFAPSLDIKVTEKKFPLEYEFSDELEWIYNDKGTGSKKDFSIWRVKVPAGYARLGDFAWATHQTPKNQKVIVVKDNPEYVKKPLDYRLIWTDAGSGGKYSVSLWEPVGPKGFVALGTIAVAGYEKPDLNLVRTVREDLTREGSFSLVWTDKGSGAKKDLGVFEATGGLVSTNTFLGANNYTGNNRKFPVLYQAQDSTYSGDKLLYKYWPVSDSLYIGEEGEDSVSIWRARLPAGYVSLGDYAVSYRDKPESGVLILRDHPDYLKKPVDYELIWDGTGTGAQSDVYIWKPIAPDGYVALGYVASKTNQKPSLDLIRTVKKNYAVEAKVEQIWFGSGSGAKKFVSLWMVSDTDIRTKTFIAADSYFRPSSFWALNGEKVILY